MARDKENATGMTNEKYESGGTRSPAGLNRLTLDKPVGDYG